MIALITEKGSADHCANHLETALQQTLRSWLIQVLSDSIFILQRLKPSYGRWEYNVVVQSNEFWSHINVRSNRIEVTTLNSSYKKI